MSIGPISDVVTTALSVAMDGLDARQRATSANIANVETPGYLAREVRFEDSLRSAIASGDPGRAGFSVEQSLAATRTNGNNVNIDFEVLAGAENVLRQRLVVQALNAKYSLLRTSIAGQ